ncbi:TnsA-like heteromeric transposase endonuclease subunit [Leifsonia xyli]|uniref:TnsA-like heteromeric transposase endonuclease subunit n=1 Tax=Leifsonia xyli TaxID=1575 RepID=UPI003D67D0CA
MPGRNKQVYKAIKPIEPRSRDLVLWFDSRGAKHVENPSPALLHEPFHSTRRAREPVQYHGQLHRPGKYWFSQLDAHVWHESLFEKWALMFLDFLSPVESITPQPCMMQFEDGSYHYPDYFIIHADGTQALLDVHFEGVVNDRIRRQFANTQRICDSIGWRYETFTAVDGALLKNVLLFSLSRHPRWAPTEPERAWLLEAVSNKCLDEVMAEHPETSPAVLTSQVYHLLWAGYLTADLTLPFTTQTILRKGI